MQRFANDGKFRRKCKVHRQISSKITSTANWSPFGFLIVLFALISCVQFGPQFSSALKVSVAIPELVKLNDAFWLNCSHEKPFGSSSALVEPSNQEPDGNGGSDRTGKTNRIEEDIYAIKWFKDNEEFYKYSPNANPKVSIYETNGIQLDAKSHEGNVFLSKADVNTEGEYRCEILSEAPLFETVRKSKHLRVYALPVKSPKIDILDANGRAKSPKDHDMSYAIGDRIDLVCNSAPSKPAARLRWYLNEREIQVPAPNASTTMAISSRRQRRAALNSALHHNLANRHDVKVTPVEYRQHYKGIYSSHSTLSLVLQQDDLINNKISFKCLASMRQDVPYKSKQLIVLMQAVAASSRLSAQSRMKRSLAAALSPLSSDFQATIASLTDNEAHVHHRQRPSHHRHSMSRLPPQPSPPLAAQQLDSSPSSSRPQAQQRAASLDGNGIGMGIANKDQMWYIYEEADSTLGPSIIDKPEDLETYLMKYGAQFNDSLLESAMNGAGALPLDRADNMDYIQVLRDRQARQRTYHHATGLHQTRPRLHSPGIFVKSPHYSEEHDATRPIIGWPPLDSGKLILLGNSIVALPAQTAANRQRHSATDRKFILSPKMLDQLDIDAQAFDARSLAGETDKTHINLMMLDRLLSSLNCTCTDGAIDTKMSWIINDMPLDLRDTRFYPTRVSADHRQTMLAIGLQIPNSKQILSSLSSARFKHMTTSSSSSLQTIIAQYFKNSPEFDVGNRAGGQQSPPYDQIKFTCQALYSMLLYSSSETITFDFNPQSMTDGGNSIDKPLLPNNVIQATSASQSSSAHGWTMDIISARSQINYVMSLITLVMFVFLMHR